MHNLNATLPNMREFPPIRDNCGVPVGMKEEYIVYSIPVKADEKLKHLLPSDLPDRMYTLDNAKITCSSSAARALQTAPLSKFHKIWIAWLEEGGVSALKLALLGEGGSNTLAKVLERIKLNLNKFIGRTNIQGNEKTLLSPYSGCKDWKSDSVHSVAWHPHLSKYALITSNDTIIVLSEGCDQIVLDHHCQNYVTSVSWRPYSACDLAAGCEHGVLLWKMDPNKLSGKRTPKSAHLLSQPGHKYVTSICWNPLGNLLLSCSPFDSAMYLWDASAHEAVPLKKFGGFPVFACWSPLSNRVFVGTTNVVFRIWSCDGISLKSEWWQEKWFVPSGRVKCACWSPKGCVLLFATTTEASIFAVATIDPFAVFAGGDRNGRDKKSLRVLNLTKQEIEPDRFFGGEVESMDWDPSGRYLAVLFVYTDLIAVYSTIVTNIVRLIPKCLIPGRLNEKPVALKFQQNCTSGANLCIVWSSGRLQYFPILTSDGVTQEKNGW